MKILLTNHVVSAEFRVSGLFRAKVSEKNHDALWMIIIINNNKCELFYELVVRKQKRLKCRLNVSRLSSLHLR